MKKILSVIFLFALLASGCNQDDLSEQSNSLKFTASFEQNESRTYIDANKSLHWSEGDKISLFYGNTLNQQYKFDGNTGDTEGTFSPTEATSNIVSNNITRNHALYPYASEVEISENGAITATLPATQNYVEKSFGLGANTMVAITESTEDKSLYFKNIGGYLKLQLHGSDVTVKSITLTGNNNEKLAGQATITYDQIPTIQIADNATKSITLNCGENGVKIGTTAETATAFWIVVPPTTFEKGLEVTITDINGGTLTKSTSNEITIERNVIKPMAALEVEIIPNNQIWYTTTDQKILSLTYAASFGANWLSNNYDNGKGVITFDNPITEIGGEGFMNCTTITDIIIPNTVKSICGNAFEYCTSLKSITLPNDITTIYGRTFYQCYSLKEINIPQTVTSFVGEEIFANCTSLESFDLPEGITAINKKMFDNCKSLKTITIPETVTTINDFAFRYCQALAQIEIPDDVTSIGISAFAECGSLSKVVIPSKITSIGISAFSNCDALKTIYCKSTTPPTLGENAFHKNIGTIYVPKGYEDNYKKATGWSELSEYIQGYNF